MRPIPMMLALVLLGSLAGPVSTSRNSDDRDNCDDCVIVLAPESEPARAGTLWGLFLLARTRAAKRKPPEEAQEIKN